jgi:hypothetical protein
MALRSRLKKRRFNVRSGRHSRSNQSKYKLLQKRVLRACHRFATPYKLPRKFVKRYYRVELLGPAVLRFCKSQRPATTATTATKNGYRILNISELSEHVATITRHAALCIAEAGGAPVMLFGVIQDIGLAVCNGCQQTSRVHSSPKLATSSGSQRYEVDVRGVWSQMSYGGGADKLNEQMATMGIVGLSGNSFSAIEQEIGVWWKAALLSQMEEAGREERDLAVQRGDLHEGVPAITVVCDGGWSKRSHKHSYNAAGGVAVIIGQVTKKVLYVGVSNKNCSVCSYANTRSIPVREHDCHRNWYESSQAMEADLILKGFIECEETHHVRYMRYIGDGDSSTMATLLMRGPIWCKAIVKLECANHSCKCLPSRLEELVVTKPAYKGVGGLTKAVRIRMCARR